MTYRQVMRVGPRGELQPTYVLQPPTSMFSSGTLQSRPRACAPAMINRHTTLGLLVYTFVTILLRGVCSSGHNQQRFYCDDD
jgi:hypothetical protein